MTHTFDIRFGKSAGLAGLFEAPANNLRFKGSGRLSVDPHGIDIAVKRGLMTLFSRKRSRRIAANNLLQVYREGETLRLGFSTGRSTRDELAIWAQDRDVAAQIIKLLPTPHTLELEQPVAARPQRFRPDWRLIAALTLALAALVYIVLTWQRSASPVPDEANQRAPRRESLNIPANSAQYAQTETGASLPATISPSARTGDSIPPRSPAAASSARFPEASLAPPDYLANASPAPMDETVAATDSAAGISFAEEYQLGPRPPGSPNRLLVRDGIVAIMPGDPVYEVALNQLRIFEEESRAVGLHPQGWWDVTVRIHNTGWLDHPDLYGMRETMLAISRARRAGDNDFADMLQVRLHYYVY